MGCVSKPTLASIIESHQLLPSVETALCAVLQRESVDCDFRTLAAQPDVVKVVEAAAEALPEDVAAPKSETTV